MPIIAEFDMIIGQDVTNKNPYATKNAQAKEFTILNFFKSFIKNEPSNVNIAKYPIHSTAGILKICILN